MNALDFIIFIVLIALLIQARKLQFTYVIVCTLFIIVGLISGLLIALYIAPNLNTDIKRGVVSLVIMIIFALGSFFIGRLVGGRIKVKVLLTRFAKLDNYLGIPALLVSSAAILSLLAGVLTYIPILSLQFETQGSAFMINASKYVPIERIMTIAKKISPEQFEHLTLQYDAEPITDENIENAGDFQKVVEHSTSSIFKVSGNGCVRKGFGTGFIAAPHLIVTNAHVVTGLGTIYVRNSKGSYPATPIVVDRAHDIAVLRSVYINESPLEFATTQSEIDDLVAIIGYPFGGNVRLSTGKLTPTPANIFQGIKLNLNNANIYTTNASVAPGNSGSPLLDINGKVIGVINSGRGEISAAIKSELVIPLINKAKNSHFSTNTGDCDVFDWYK